MSRRRTDSGIGEFQLSISGDHEIAYLRLPNYPRDRPMKTSKSFRLVDLIGPYNGPDMVFDFDQSGSLVGIEVLAD